MTEDICIAKEHVAVKTKFSFGVGSLANFLLSSIVFANLSFFYVEKLGANAALTGIAWLIFGIWNVINDPIVSYFIDNTRTKIGRRIPYIRYGSILYGLAFIFCWFPFASYGDEWGLFFNFLLTLFLLDTIFSTVGCCFFALPNEIAVTAEGRASVSVFNSIFYVAAIAIGFIVPIFLFTGQNGGVHPLFAPIMLLIGFGSTVLLFFSSYGIKENMFAQLQEHEPFIEGLRLTLKNKPFWIFMIPAFCIALLLPILQLGILYYIDYIVQGRDFSIALIGIAGGAVLGLYITMTKVEKWGPKNVMIISLTSGAIGFFLFFILGRDLLAMTIPGILIGIGIAGSLITQMVIIGDCIDNDELITGKRREAIYGGVNAIVTKYPVSLANWLFLLVITGFGFIAPMLENGVNVKQTQSEMAITGILFALCLIPAIFLAFSSLAMFKYPLHGGEWKKKKDGIIKLHEEKHLEYLKKCNEKGIILTKKEQVNDK